MIVQGMFLIFLKHFFGEVLRIDEDLEEIIPKSPQVTFRKGRSLRDRLAHSHFIPLPPKKALGLKKKKTVGTFRCASNCLACLFINQTKQFQSHSSGIKYKIRDFAHFNWKESICDGLCTYDCPLDYIRKTKRQWRCRIRDHLCDIHNRRDKHQLPVTL